MMEVKVEEGDPCSSLNGSDNAGWSHGESLSQGRTVKSECEEGGSPYAVMNHSNDTGGNLMLPLCDKAEPSVVDGCSGGESPIQGRMVKSECEEGDLYGAMNHSNDGGEKLMLALCDKVEPSVVDGGESSLTDYPSATSTCVGVVDSVQKVKKKRILSDETLCRGSSSAKSSIDSEPCRRPCLSDVNFSVRYLYREVLTSEENCISWLAAHGLLLNERLCPGCNQLMTLFRESTAWRCNPCKKDLSVRRDSFFHEKRLPLTTILELLYWWSLDQKQSIVRRELDLSKNTVSSWYRLCRQLCVQYFEDHPPLIGGVGKEVEIDESVFSTRKYQRERYPPSQWVLGGVERGSDGRAAFFTVVPDRSAATLLPIIQRYVLPGTRILTDCWRSYQQLSSHTAVNHSLHFVDPNDRTVHTNTIKGMWRHVKDILRQQKGIPRELLDEHLLEIQWRRQMDDACFAQLLYWLDFYRL